MGPPAAAANVQVPEDRSIATEDDLRQALAEDGIEFLFAMFVDLHGKPCAKLVPVSALDGLLENGAGFAGFAAGAIGQVPSSPDLAAMPDISSYLPAPWQPGLGIIQCDPHCEGEPWPFAPGSSSGASSGGSIRPAWP